MSNKISPEDADSLIQNARHSLVEEDYSERMTEMISKTTGEEEEESEEEYSEEEGLDTDKLLLNNNLYAQDESDEEDKISKESVQKSTLIQQKIKNSGIKKNQAKKPK